MTRHFISMILLAAALPAAAEVSRERTEAKAGRESDGRQTRSCARRWNAAAESLKRAGGTALAAALAILFYDDDRLPATDEGQDRRERRAQEKQ